MPTVSTAAPAATSWGSTACRPRPPTPSSAMLGIIVKNGVQAGFKRAF